MNFYEIKNNCDLDYLDYIYFPHRQIYQKMVFFPFLS